jgi:hypothetical protein
MRKFERLGQAGGAFPGITPMLIGTFFFLVPAGFLYCQFAGPDAATAAPHADDYARAVLESQNVGAAPGSAWLFVVNPDQPLTLITWIPHKYTSAYRESKSLDRDIWVTVAPFLKEFCQDYVKSNNPSPIQLALRLKQRLGLPPNADYDTIVELRIDSPRKALLFRPCGGDPIISDNKCSASMPESSNVWKLPDSYSLSSADRQTEWVLRNYYANYSASSPYPWTALGYTFDWYKDSQGNYIRKGESEFVLPAGAQFQFQSATDTGSYCQP